MSGETRDLKLHLLESPMSCRRINQVERTAPLLMPKTQLQLRICSVSAT